MSRELDLLIACGFAAPETAGRHVSKFLAGPLDWRALIRLAEEQGLLPLLWRALNRAGAAFGAARANAPEAIAEIGAAAMEKAVRSLRMAGELTRICENLRGAGVEAVAFKGPALACLAYGDLALRDYTDLDLFVPRPQLSTALQVLAAEGYGKKTAAWNTWFRGACEIALGRRAPDCEVDLHWLFTSPYFLPFDASRAVERSIVVRSAGFMARTLCPEDYLLYLSIHAAREGWGLVRFACDIAALLAHCTPDWGDVANQARLAGSWRALAVAVNLAHELYGAPAPADVIERARRDRSIVRLTAEARARMGGDVYGASGVRRGARFHFRMMESLPAKANYLWRRALQPNQLDAEWIRLPETFSAGYYLVRPVRLVGRMLGMWGR